MLWGCQGCTTAYSVGAPACPHCGSTDYREVSDMAKITVHGGPSYEEDAGHDGTGSDQGEGEQSSPGNSSSASGGKPQPSASTSSPAAQSPAPTTGSHSGKARTGGSTATSTAGPRPGSRAGS